MRKLERQMTEAIKTKSLLIHIIRMYIHDWNGLWNTGQIGERTVLRNHFACLVWESIFVVLCCGGEEGVTEIEAVRGRRLSVREF